KTKKYSTLVSLPDRDILGPLTELRSDKIIGYIVDGDYIRYKFFDEETQKRYDALAEQVGDYNFYFSSHTNDGKKSIVSIYGPDNPLSFSLYDHDYNNLTFIQNAYFNIATKHLSYPALANYMTRDGVFIRAYLLFPNG